MKKTLLLIIFIGCSYSQSQAMLARHAHRIRVFNQIKQSWNSTETTTPKSSDSFWKILFDFVTGAVGSATVYEKYPDKKEKVFKLVHGTINEPKYVPQP